MRSEQLGADLGTRCAAPGRRLRGGHGPARRAVTTQLEGPRRAGTSGSCLDQLTESASVVAVQSRTIVVEVEHVDDPAGRISPGSTSCRPRAPAGPPGWPRASPHREGTERPRPYDTDDDWPGPTGDPGNDGLAGRAAGTPGPPDSRPPLAARRQRPRGPRRRPHPGLRARRLASRHDRGRRRGRGHRAGEPRADRRTRRARRDLGRHDRRGLRRLAGGVRRPRLVEPARLWARVRPDPRRRLPGLGRRGAADHQRRDHDDAIGVHRSRAEPDAADDRRCPRPARARRT